MTISENPFPAAAHAQHVQSFGRGNDTMLIHMTPREVSGLQELAMAHGGSLTINPHTGLPEAGFLDSILPILAGGLLSLIPGVGALAAAGITTAGTTAVTGDLSKGLMAGLGAFGGASLAGAAGLGGSAGAASAASSGAGAAGSAGTAGVASSGAGAAGSAGAAGAAGAASGISNLSPALQAAMAPAVAVPSSAGLTAITPITAPALSGASAAGTGAAASSLSNLSPALQAAMNPAVAVPSSASLGAIAPTAALNTTPGFLTRFADVAASGVKPLGLPRAAGVGLAGLGVTAPLMQLERPIPTGQDNESNYEGPYRAQPRTLTAQPPRIPGAPMDSSERLYFEDTNPYPGYLTAAGTLPAAAALPDVSAGFFGPSVRQFFSANRSPRFAEGGDVALDNGGFVVDARTVSELGNGSSSAGQELLARYGGKAIKGGGDGVSDSVPANIDGVQKARVARDEVKFDARAVARIGRGDSRRGAQKLYAMMAKAHADRKRAARGENTEARGLAALR